jgi:putative spermidine/putrescine transport system substrate-binding protein
MVEVRSLAAQPRVLHWIKANPGKFAYSDPATGGAGGAFLVTCVFNFLPGEAITSSDEKWMAQSDASFAVLKDLYPYLYKASGKVQYTVKNQGSLDLLAAGTIWMCPAWADTTLNQKSRRLLPASTKLQQIDPPLTSTLALLAIPSMSKNAAAQKFINCALSPEAQNIIATVNHSNLVIDTKRLPAATFEMLAGFDPGVYRTSALGGLRTMLNERWTKEIATLP